MQEVFKSDFYDSVPFDKVLGKCYIMCVKEYFKMKPEASAFFVSIMFHAYAYATAAYFMMLLF